MTISPFEVSNEVRQAESDMDKASSEAPLPSKYTRDIDGHTKLVRKGNEIFLAKRHKKASGEFENVNYPDAVLLTDEEKKTTLSTIVRTRDYLNTESNKKKKPKVSKFGLIL